MLDIRLLGDPEATLGGKPIVVDTRKAIALLAYLAVESAASRDIIAGLFWADSSAERARASLRRTLSSLRSGAGADVIAADRSKIALVGDHAIDVREFERLVSETGQHDHPAADVCSDCIPLLSDATQLYRGDFLAGFYVRDAAEFEDWARLIGEGLRIKAGDAFNRLAMAHAASGDYSAAIRAVNRWIDLDALHEPAHRLLMLLNAWAGIRPDAIEAYRKFVATLSRELGVPPLDETTELYEAILDEDLPPAPGIPRQVKTSTSPVARQSTMLNRTSELAALQSTFLESPSHGVVVAVTGASWMGKTRLIEEVVQTDPASRGALLTGRAFRMEQSLPFGIATQLLHDLGQVAPDYPDVLPRWALTVAARLSPELRQEDGSIDEEGGELRLFEAVNAIVMALSMHTTVTVVCDDVQWIDNASAQLLSYLAHRILHARNVALVMGCRTGERLSEPARALLDSANQVIELRPLTADELTGLVDSPDEASRIVSITGGVPLLAAEELSGAGQETAGVSRYMEAQLESLGDLSRQVLTAASVLTGICEATLLRETSGRTDEEFVESIEELIRTGVLREEADGEGLSFTLDRLAAMVYERMSMVRRRLLHQRAAQALASRSRSRSDARLAAAVAHQFHQAGDDDAATWYRLAGDLARDEYANTEAVDFYERAIALGVHDLADLQIALGELAMRSGDYGRAATHLTSATENSDGERLGRAEHRLGEVQRMLGRLDIAEEHFRRAEALIPSSPDLYCDWALIHHRRAQPKKALAMAKRAVEAAKIGDDPGVLSRALNILAITDANAADGMAHVNQALDLSSDSEEARMAALNTKARLLAGIGNTDAATRLLEEALAIASRTGFRHREAALYNHLADVHHQASHVTKADEAMTKAVTLFSDIDAGAWEPEVWLLSEW